MNMTTERSTYTYEGGEQETVTLSRGPATPHGHAVLRINYSDGQAVDCYVNTEWLRDRAEQLVQQRPEGAEDIEALLFDAGVDENRAEDAQGAAVEWMCRTKKAEHDLIALQDEVNELWPYRKRAEKAEEERDEARRYECSDLDAHWRLGEALASLKEANATVASLRAEQPRPLTADDIEQLVTQNRCRVADAIRALYPEEPMATDVLAHAVMTALTEPTRPEGAEKVEAVLHQYWSGDINGDDLANRIAEEVNR